jgi:hypothetical protein
MRSIRHATILPGTIKIRGCAQTPACQNKDVVVVPCNLYILQLLNPCQGVFLVRSLR